jgi:hypothetical protein
MRRMSEPGLYANASFRLKGNNVREPVDTLEAYSRDLQRPPFVIDEPIEVEGLFRTIKNLLAVDNISFTVETGEIFGFSMTPCLRS